MRDTDDEQQGISGGSDDRALAVEFARQRPADVRAQIAAAYALDRVGDEHGALRFYTRAWRLGVPDDARRAFLVGYGSTLRNTGRVAESVRVLRQAVEAYPESHALTAFLALSLHTAGRYREAFARLMGSALDAARPDGFDGFERALRAYQAELATDDAGPQPRP